MVGNGWQPDGLPDGVRAVALAEDRGIPAGRNAGVGAVGGELLFFLDDDARLAAPDALARVAARFAADPGLGLLQLRVDARSDGGPAAARLGAAAARRRPRALERRHRGLGGRGGDPRARVFEQVGGWPEAFRFAPTRASTSPGA